MREYQGKTGIEEKDSLDCYLRASGQLKPENRLNEIYMCGTCAKTFTDYHYWKRHQYWCEITNDSDIWYMYREEGRKIK